MYGPPLWISNINIAVMWRFYCFWRYMFLTVALHWYFTLTDSWITEVFEANPLAFTLTDHSQLDYWSIWSKPIGIHSHRPLSAGLLKCLKQTHWHLLSQTTLSWITEVFEANPLAFTLTDHSQLDYWSVWSKPIGIHSHRPLSACLLKCLKQMHWQLLSQTTLSLLTEVFEANALAVTLTDHSQLDYWTDWIHKVTAHLAGGGGGVHCGRQTYGMPKFGARSSSVAYRFEGNVLDPWCAIREWLFC
jgi:hypothetical protein